MVAVNYLVHFRPNKHLTGLILQKPDIELPSCGPHATLCFFNMNPEKEAEYKRQLAMIHFQPFTTRTKYLSLFDENSLMITLEKTSQLEILHTNITNLSRWYASNPDEFKEIKAKYYYQNYNPHITISKKGSLNDLKNSSFYKDLFDVKFRVNELVLSKKEGEWSEIHHVHGSYFQPGSAFVKAKYLTKVLKKSENEGL